MKKILVVNVNWLGDVLFSVPALKAIKYGSKQDVFLSVMVPSRCRRVLEYNPVVDEIIEFDERVSHRGLISKIKYVLFLRKKRFDKAIFFHRSSIRIILCKLAGIKVREGYYRRKTKNLLSKKVKPLDKNKIHKSEYLINLVEKLGYKVREKSYDFYVTQDDLDEAEGLLIANDVDISKDILIALHPGANWPPKRWPVKNWVKLIDLLLNDREKKYKIVITGNRKDRELAEVIKRNVKSKSDKVLNLCGKTTLGSLGGIFLYCNILVSADSGSLHIGCALTLHVDLLEKDHKPPFCIGLYGPTSKELTGPIGGNCEVIEGERRKDCKMPCYDYSCQEHVCMDSIDPAEVFELIKNTY